MYYYITGKLISLSRNTAVIDNSGIGYELFVSDKTAGRLQGSDGEVRLYTYFSIKEDAHELYGFYSLEEKRIFEMLISVSGVGPKASMAVLSALSVKEFYMAVLSDDAKAISSAQGIGIRTAQKIILELKDKLAKEDISSPTLSKSSPSKTAISSEMSDALLSLEALGYTRSEALSAMNFDKSDTLSAPELIRLALKRLTKQ